MKVHGVVVEKYKLTWLESGKRLGSKVREEHGEDIREICWGVVRVVMENSTQRVSDCFSESKGSKFTGLFLIQDRVTNMFLWKCMLPHTSDIWGLCSETPT